MERSNQETNRHTKESRSPRGSGPIIQYNAVQYNAVHYGTMHYNVHGQNNRIASKQHVRSKHEPIISREDITNQVNRPRSLLQDHPPMKSNFLMSKLH